MLDLFIVHLIFFQQMSKQIFGHLGTLITLLGETLHQLVKQLSIV